jgi:flavin reductase (DIM6/NTAB) family NADH-FMN oxidoreductase RutF
VDAARFRQLLGTFATGVAVVTVRDPDGRPEGMTASAIASVSLDPPLLLVCVGREAEFHRPLGRARHFALNVLAEDQEALSRRFAADVADRFAGVAWEPHASGAPLLEGAAAHIICAQWSAHLAGDHTVFFGQVTDGAVFPREPLLHVHGGYRRLE